MRNCKGLGELPLESKKIPTPSFPNFLPSPFLMCCAILPTSFGRKLGFSLAVRQMLEDLCTAPRIILLSPLSLVTDVTDATLGASGLWLGTRTGAGGTATLTESFFFDCSPWLHEQQESKKDG